MDCQYPQPEPVRASEDGASQRDEDQEQDQAAPAAQATAASKAEPPLQAAEEPAGAFVCSKRPATTLIPPAA